MYIEHKKSWHKYTSDHKSWNPHFLFFNSFIRNSKTWLHFINLEIIISTWTLTGLKMNDLFDPVAVFDDKIQLHHLNQLNKKKTAPTCLLIKSNTSSILCLWHSNLMNKIELSKLKAMTWCYRIVYWIPSIFVKYFFFFVALIIISVSFMPEII